LERRENYSSEKWSENWRNETDDYDKGDLKDELKSSGFSDCVANVIADNVDEIAEGEWSQKLARQEAIRQIDSFMESNLSASDKYKQRAGSTGQTVRAAASTY